MGVPNLPLNLWVSQIYTPNLHLLGVVPLFFDAFFQSMAVVIVFGLTFATLLTLLIVPVLYSIFMKVKVN